MEQQTQNLNYVHCLSKTSKRPLRGYQKSKRWIVTEFKWKQTNNSNKNLPDHTSVFKYLLSPNMWSKNCHYCHKYKTKNALKLLYIKSETMNTNFLHDVFAKQNYQVTLGDIILDSVHCKLTYCLRRQKLEVQCGNLQRLAPSSRTSLSPSCSGC